jgi:hypothetical protein
MTVIINNFTTGSIEQSPKLSTELYCRVPASVTRLEQYEFTQTDANSAPIILRGRMNNRGDEWLSEVTKNDKCLTIYSFWDLPMRAGALSPQKAAGYAENDHPERSRYRPKRRPQPKIDIPWVIDLGHRVFFLDHIR